MDHAPVKKEEARVFPAHILENRIQDCRDHCLHTAECAKKEAMPAGLGTTAFLAGLLHDCGKFTTEFENYIEKAVKGEQVRKGSVIHSFAGVFYMLTRYHQDCQTDPIKKLTAEMIASAIGSHHGLFDCVNSQGDNGFTYRLNKQPGYEEEAIGNLLSGFEKGAGIDDLFSSASIEVKKLLTNINLMSASSREIYLYLSFAERLLSSAVIDGDRRDTAEFLGMGDGRSFIRAERSLWSECRNHLERVRSSFAGDTEIQKARQRISDICLNFASEEPGIYRLNVPTGGGKTLSSLRYALAHAEIHGKKRIIYTAPLISILDQSAGVIREALSNDAIILEHHSNVIQDADDKEYSNYSLLTDTWDVPVIITTMAQLLNTFFSSKTSCVRRFQSLCDSVLIIDEVQSVPLNMLSLFNLMINFLYKICGVTVILCSATQPTLERLNHGMLISENDIIPKDAFHTFEKVFERTELIDGGKCSYSKIVEHVEKLQVKNNSVLVICNTKNEAAQLYRAFRKDQKNCVHLSASMCMAHRKRVLRKLFESLHSGEKIICVSTQVIEAGVDISFNAVVRFSAGMDEIIQSAGRCNRNGEIEGRAPVYIVECEDEHIGLMKEMKAGQDATKELLYRFSRYPMEYDADLSSKKSIDYYYNVLYRILKNEIGENYFDYSVEEGGSVMTLLSQNEFFCTGDDGYVMHQAFKTAGDQFTVFGDDEASVVVPYGEGETVIEDLLSERAGKDTAFLQRLIRNAKEYTVSVYSNQLRTLFRQGAIKSICDGTVNILSKNWYDLDLGVQLEPIKEEDSECSILIL